MFHHYKGTRIPPLVTESAVDSVEKLELRDDDILIGTYPKSGTHWINEVIQLILHDGEPSQLHHSHRRVPLELRDTLDITKGLDLLKPSVELVAADPSPRVLLTHLRPHHFPEQTWTKRIPIIYVMRNPKDVFLSMFEFYCEFTLPNGQPFWSKQDFSKYLQEFVTGEVAFDGWCKHVISFEELERRNENILIVTYEEMKKDIAGVVKRVAKHIKRDVTDDIVRRVVENSTLEGMRKSYAITMEERKNEHEFPAEPVSLFEFLKKGVAGRWKTEYPEEKWKPLQDKFKEETKDTIYAKQYFQ